jgi:hypothetical protein
MPLLSSTAHVPHVPSPRPADKGGRVRNGGIMDSTNKNNYKSIVAETYN